MLLTARVLGKVLIQTPHEALVTKAVRLLFFELPLSVLLNIRSLIRITIISRRQSCIELM